MNSLLPWFDSHGIPRKYTYFAITWFNKAQWHREQRGFYATQHGFYAGIIMRHEQRAIECEEISWRFLIIEAERNILI